MKRTFIILSAYMLISSMSIASTVLPVGPITFDTQAEYDDNFKETNAGTAYLTYSSTSKAVAQVTENATGNAVYDTTGSHANNDLQDYIISMDVRFGYLASSTSSYYNQEMQFYLRMDDNQENGYLAKFVFSRENRVVFELWRDASFASNGTLVGSVPLLTAQTMATGTYYNCIVSVDGSDFGLSIVDGSDEILASTSFSDSTKNAAGQVGIGGYLPFASTSKTIVMDNFEITSIPEPTMMGFIIAGLPMLLSRRSKR